jgi:hypothetical protein
MASGVRRITRLAAATALVTTLAPVLGWTSLAYAQAPAGSKPGERMVVDARELVYDKDNNTVSAVGDVPDSLPGPHDRSRPRRLRPPEQARGRDRQCPHHRIQRHGDHRRPLQPDRRFPRRLHRLAARGEHRQDPLLGAARRADRRRGLRLRQGHLHGLRALRGPARAPAFLAGARGSDHPQEGRTDDLLRGGPAGVRRCPDRLHSLHVRAGRDR